MISRNITYDRDWVQEYIDRLRNQRYLSEELQRVVSYLKFTAMPEELMEIKRIEEQIETLSGSIHSTEKSLIRYMENMEEAIYQFQQFME